MCYSFSQMNIIVSHKTINCHIYYPPYTYILTGACQLSSQLVS